MWKEKIEAAAEAWVKKHNIPDAWPTPFLAEQIGYFGGAAYESSATWALREVARMIIALRENPETPRLDYLHSIDELTDGLVLEFGNEK